MVDISERIRSKNCNFSPSLGEMVGNSYSSGSDKLLNRCLSVRPKFMYPVMENSSFCKISRNRCLPNLSPKDQNIPFPVAFFLGMPDDGQVPKRAWHIVVRTHCIGPAKPATFHIDFFVRIILKQVLNIWLSVLLIFTLPNTVFLISVESQSRYTVGSVTLYSGNCTLTSEGCRHWIVLWVTHPWGDKLRHGNYRHHVLFITTRT